jgi:hypothetical protein
MVNSEQWIVNSEFKDSRVSAILIGGPSAGFKGSKGKRTKQTIDKKSSQ